MREEIEKVLHGISILKSPRVYNSDLHDFVEHPSISAIYPDGIAYKMIQKDTHITNGFINDVLTVNLKFSNDIFISLLKRPTLKNPSIPKKMKQINIFIDILTSEETPYGYAEKHFDELRTLRDELEFSFVDVSEFCVIMCTKVIALLLLTANCYFKNLDTAITRIRVNGAYTKYFVYEYYFRYINKCNRSDVGIEPDPVRDAAIILISVVTDQTIPDVLIPLVEEDLPFLKTYIDSSNEKESIIVSKVDSIKV